MQDLVNEFNLYMEYYCGRQGTLEEFYAWTKYYYNITPTLSSCLRIKVPQNEPEIWIDEQEIEVNRKYPDYEGSLERVKALYTYESFTPVCTKNYPKERTISPPLDTKIIEAKTDNKISEDIVNVSRESDRNSAET